MEERKSRLEKELKAALNREEQLSGKLETAEARATESREEHEKEIGRLRSELERKIAEGDERVMHMAGELEKERKGRAKEQREQGRLGELETQVAVLEERVEAMGKAIKEKERLLKEGQEKMEAMKEKRKNLRAEMQ